MSPRSTGLTLATRNGVLARDEHQCQRCGRMVRQDDYSLQHRRPRGTGGSTLEHINTAPNLITLCGSATTGCHGWVESHREESRLFGWAIRLNAAYLPVAVPWRGMSRGIDVWFQAAGLFRIRMPERDAIEVLVKLGIREDI